MIRSMSGYGRGQAENDALRVAVEIRSVNHRFCRVALHFPSELAFFEAPARRLIRERVERGKVDVAATVSGPKGNPMVQIDRPLAESYLRALAELGAELGIPGNIELARVAELPGVIAVQSTPKVEPERDLAAAEAALRQALEALDSMRTSEGEHLAEDIRHRLEQIGSVATRLGEVAEELPARYRDQLHRRIETLCVEMEGDLDAVRLAQEVAYYADRSDITEELVRLRSHVDKGREILDAGGPVGRSLEFLLQELHREVNTIGSKAKVMDVSEIVVDVKSELERIREQVQNLE